MKTIYKQIRTERKKFQKQKKGFFKKINKLSIFYHTDLYFVIYQSERYYIYNSTKKQNLSPNENNLIQKLYFMRI